MLPTYTIDPTLRIVRFDVAEHLPSLADLQRVLDQLAADPLFRRGFGILVNVRDLSADPTYVRSALVTIFARLSIFGASRWAFLTSNLESYYSRVVTEAYARSHGLMYRVFREETEAMNWLRADADVARSQGSIRQRR